MIGMSTIGFVREHPYFNHVMVTQGTEYRYLFKHTYGLYRCGRFYGSRIHNNAVTLDPAAFFQVYLPTPIFGVKMATDNGDEFCSCHDKSMT